MSRTRNKDTVDRGRVVVVGAGVAGLRAARLLSKRKEFDVTLISKKKTFDHRTSLMRSRRGRSKRHVTVPLENIFSRRAHIDLVRAEIVTVEPGNPGRVVSKEGISYEFDSLIVALEGDHRVLPGSSQESDHVFSAYNASNMDDLRRLLITTYENGTPPGHFAVVGGGEAGIEMAAELRIFLRSLAKRYKTRSKEPQIGLLEGASTLLSQTDDDISSRVVARLQKMNISVVLGKAMRGVQPGQIKIDGGKTLKADIVIAAAGTRANHLFHDNDGTFLLDRRNFVRVTSLLEAEGHSNIYIVGNSKSSARRLDTAGKLYDAEYVTGIMLRKHYGRQISEYDPPPYRTSMVIGRFWGAVHTTHRYFGRRGWLLKRWIDCRHFSTLLPMRLWFTVCLRGSKHDDIR